ncbi:MAG: N-acetylmuramoyl-L-alanine amidase [Erysipelotrichaceae bacterium]
MVKVTERSVCRGVAGRRSGDVKGVVIHNTWDNLPASHHLTRLANSNNNQLANGFAHYYIDENEIIRVEDTFNGAWHVANYEGNMYYLGYEVKGDRSTPSDILKRAEQNAFWQAAIDLRFYKLPVNRNTVRLHHEFSATECPKRSLIEHCGYDSTYAVPTHITNKLKDYFIKEIKKYYDNPNLKPNETGGKEVAKVKNNRKPHFVVTGDYRKATTASRKVENFLKEEGMKHKVVSDKKDRDKIWFVVGSFGQDSTWKLKLEQFLQENNYSYVVCLEKQTQMLIDKW